MRAIITGLLFAATAALCGGVVVWAAAEYGHYSAEEIV